MRRHVSALCATAFLSFFATETGAAEKEINRPAVPRAGAALDVGDELPAHARRRKVHDENGCFGGRVLDYLERHGDMGQIDPEVRLYLAREIYDEYKREREGRRLQTQGLSGSTWTSLGPNNGAGRMIAVAPHPTVATTAWVGAAGGGVWKTTDSGANWTVLTDGLPNLSIGAVAVATSDPTIVYAGTGEGGYAFDFIPGIGLLKSTDGGVNWTLPDSASVTGSMFYRVMIHPTNANELVVGTNNGAFRSTAGQNGPWTNVISNTTYGDVTDIVRDPVTPNTMYATTEGTLETVLKSTDGGANWNPANTGLPDSSVAGAVSRMSIAISPSNPQVLYVAFSNASNISEVYKTINGGGSWTRTNMHTSSRNGYLGAQAWYDNTIVVSPASSNTVIVGGVFYGITTDGGTSWASPTFTGSGGVHVDAHDLRYNFDGTLLWIANDGGIWTSPNHGTNATARNTGLVTRQFYGLSIDPVFANRVYGGQQDNGTSRRLDVGGTDWSFFHHSDGFQSAVLPQSSSVAYATTQNATPFRSRDAAATNAVMENVKPLYPSGESVPFFSLISPDPNNSNVVYTGTTRVWKSTTGGDAWLPLPTTTSGSLTWSTSTVRSIAVARTNSQVLMAAKGVRVYRSTDGGANWVGASTTEGLPGNKTVNHVEIDPTDANIAYAAMAGTTGTAVYYTLNGGTNWLARGTGLPSFSALVVRVDPTDPLTLYCGTDVGVYRSTDRGANWSLFGTGLPKVSTYDIQIRRDGTMLRAATHGRGVWELAVISPVNTVPSVGISLPAVEQFIARGASVTFAGTFTDGGGPVTGTWFFGDTSTTVAATSGGNVSHQFDRGGRYPVTLSATDAVGGIGAATVFVNVTESGDDCANPIVIPGAGPFPYTHTVNTTASALQGSDPGSCDPPIQTSIWFSFTPSSSGTYQFSFCGSKASAILTGYTGNACGTYTASGLCLVRTSPGTNCATETTGSQFMNAGTTYRLLVSNYFWYDWGEVSLTVTRTSALAPVIQTVRPLVGSTLGGTVVTVTGSGLDSVTSLSLGGVPLTSLSVVSTNLISGVTGAHAAGTVSATATAGANSGTLGAAFTYAGSGPPSAPTGVVATATSTSQVSVSWNVVAAADHYEVYRRAAGGSFIWIGTTTAAVFPDNGRASDTSYLYMVRAASSANELSTDSNVDVATTTIFIDPSLSSAVTVKAVHLSQLRTAILAMRALAGVGAASFTDSAIAGTPVKALHITEMRAALDAARLALSLSAQSYGNTVAGAAPVRAQDFSELRSGVQ